MEFHEKLQELRRHRGLTQEELAESLYVSRTAIPKWESGRGYPSIDSLKAIAGFFGVTIDALLSGEKLLTVAEEDAQNKAGRDRSLVYGLLDLSTAMFFFLPLFGDRSANVIQAVSLPVLTGIAPWLKTVYFTVIIGMMLSGTGLLALQSFPQRLRNRSQCGISLLLNAAGTLILISGSQPYAAALLFLYLTIKALMLIKWP